MFEHHFGSQKSRRQRNRSYILAPQLTRHHKREPDHSCLHHIEDQISPIYVRIAVADLHDQTTPGTFLRRFDHQRSSVPACDDVSVNRVLKHRETSLEIYIPERLPEYMLGALRDVVHEDVKLALLLADPPDETPYLL